MSAVIITNDPISKYFLPLDASIALLEIGFDEPCLTLRDNTTGQLMYVFKMSGSHVTTNSALITGYTTSPLIDQAIGWLLDVHQVRILDSFKNNIKKFDFIVYDTSLNGADYVKFNQEYYKKHPSRRFDTREAAILAGIKEAAGFIKNNRRIL